VDEVYAQQFVALKPRRRGRKAAMSDSEVLTLGLLAQWQRSLAGVGWGGGWPRGQFYEP